MTSNKPKWTTVVEALLELEGCTDCGARFISWSGDATYFEYGEVLERAKKVAATWQRRGLTVGDRVAIVLPTSIHFLDTFLGIQLAGGIPTALYPPFRLGKLDEYFKRTQRMLRKIGARFLVTDRRTKNLLGPAVQNVASIEDVLDAEKLLTSNTRWRRVDVTPDSPAFLQFSSGTTVEPKAVHISHTNLLHNLEMIDSLFRVVGDEEQAKQGGVCWLPLYHDMGLVGCLFLGLYHPGTVTYIGPETFLAKPKIWLQTLSKYKAVVSPAPDFAYGLCLSKVKDKDLDGVDLSHWRIALNGAEPINTEIMTRFCDRFSRWGFQATAMTPVYGLAEATLAVTFPELTSAPRVVEFDADRLSMEQTGVVGKGRRLASVGQPMQGLEVQIWDDGDNPVKSVKVGRIMVRGASICPGYYNDPKLTGKTIHKGWLDTGDLGFQHEGDLYVCGRAKDLIIIRGRNLAPQEVEELLVGVDGMRPGCAIAVGTSVEELGEQLIVLLERVAGTSRPDDALVADIKKRVLAGVGLAPYQIQILEQGTLPRTSSGKMRRNHALELFLTGKLVPPQKMGVLGLSKELAKSQMAWGNFWLRKKRRS